MQQPKTLTKSQLEAYFVQVKNGGVAAAIQIYSKLYEDGYSYAGWALGVATGETITGAAAVDYLTGSAMIGLGGEQCRNIS